MEDYNPFEDDNQPRRQPTMGSAVTAPQTFPAYNQNSQINSAYGTGTGTGTTAPQISTDELQVSHSARKHSRTHTHTIAVRVRFVQSLNQPTIELSRCDEIAQPMAIFSTK